MARLARGFLWGAATSPHQTEGNNLNSDWWLQENGVGSFLPERSGDAVDSYHRYREDMTLLADAGLNAYRFGVEWARIEPEPGKFSRAELDHYRRMIDTAIELGLTPVVTLHHFTNPRWFAEAGGWVGRDAVDRFADYVTAVSPLLTDVEWVCTINESNMVAVMADVRRSLTEMDSEVLARLAAGELPAPSAEIGTTLIAAHHAAREILRANTRAAVGWSVAQQAFTAEPGCEAQLAAANWIWEDMYLAAAIDDDFIGTQNYTSRSVGPDGPRPHPQYPDNTLTGWAYRPDALGLAVRHAWTVTAGTPVLVTENGIATAADDRRIAFTTEALSGLHAALDDGVDVRGYLHWSALDNYEWGRWDPTFGLIAVDRDTFARTPKASLAWLGDLARANRLPEVATPAESGSTHGR
ncbi:glycoside hydrolase family 1 protein [Nocardia sp. NPDC004711]